jgi:hypothetical protein
MSEVLNPYPLFFARNGEPLDSGDVYIGSDGQNPQSNPVDVFFDEAMTAPAFQPIKTMGGYPMNRGTPARLFVAASSYSVLVRDRAGALVWSALSVTSIPEFTQQFIAQLLTPQTLAEDAASVTPVNYALPEGHVERYLAWSSSSTDFTTAFQSVAAVARNKPGLTITFTHGRTYAVWPLGTGSTLFDLSSARGVTVEGNDALISAGSVSASILDVFDIKGAEGIIVRNLRLTQSYATLDANNGSRFFRIRQGSSRILLENIQQTNGLYGIGVFGELTSDGPRSNCINAMNCVFSNVFYPQNFQVSGDNYFARGIRAIGCGRSYFPYNVHSHDVELTSQHGGQFDDCLLKVFCDPALSYNKLEHIKLKYWSDGRFATASNQGVGQSLVSFDLQQNTAVSTPGQINDVQITVTHEPQASPTTDRLVIFRKFTSAGTADTTARGHIISNIKISGSVRSWQNATGPCIDLFNTTEGFTWTGDAALNILIENFYAVSSNAAQVAIQINGQPFGSGSGVILHNVMTEMRVDRANWNEQKAFEAINVSSATVVARGAYDSYTPVWSGSGGAATLGNGAIFGRFTRRGDRVTGYVQLTIGSTSSAGAGNMQFSLPVASASGEGDQLGSAVLLDTGAQFYVGTSYIADAASVANIVSNTAFVTGTAPFTIANGDVYRLNFDYICAP